MPFISFQCVQIISAAYITVELSQTVVDGLPADVLDKACKQLNIRLERNEIGPPKAYGSQKSMNNLKTHLTDALRPKSGSSAPSMLLSQPDSMEIPEEGNLRHDDKTSNPDMRQGKWSLAAPKSQGGQADRLSRQRSQISADGHPDEAGQTDDHVGRTAEQIHEAVRHDSGTPGPPIPVQHASNTLDPRPTASKDVSGASNNLTKRRGAIATGGMNGEVRTTPGTEVNPNSFSSAEAAAGIEEIKTKPCATSRSQSETPGNVLAINDHSEPPRPSLSPSYQMIDDTPSRKEPATLGDGSRRRISESCHFGKLELPADCYKEPSPDVLQEIEGICDCDLRWNAKAGRIHITAYSMEAVKDAELRLRKIYGDRSAKTQHEDLRTSSQSVETHGHFNFHRLAADPSNRSGGHEGGHSASFHSTNDRDRQKPQPKGTHSANDQTRGEDAGDKPALFGAFEIPADCQKEPNETHLQEIMGQHGCQLRWAPRSATRKIVIKGSSKESVSAAIVALQKSVAWWCMTTVKDTHNRRTVICRSHI